MTRTVLVTGATGSLGRAVLPVAISAGYQVRAMSRRNHPDDDVRWHRCDLLTREGVDQTIDGVDVILHCATQPTGAKDVTSTQNLLDAARLVGVSHVVYISIVGVDRIPMPYYKTKLRVEQALTASGVGHTVLRATQFHDLIAAADASGTVRPVAALGRRYHLVCAAAAVAQIVTLRWTWDLWKERSRPPNLPLVDWLSSFSWGPLLVVLCIATAARPRWGGPAFGVVLALACLGDQMRLQPEVVSVAILMIAPAFGDGGRSIARWHLCSLWLWAGLHKMLSLGWHDGNAAFIAASLGRPGWTDVVSVVLPLFEFGLGVTALWPRLWKVTGVGAVLLHVGVLVTLSPLYGDWNSSVWPWNAAVAVTAPLLFLSQRKGAAFPSRAVTAAAVVLLAFPALFYAGFVDAYLSHNLYTSNTASAVICRGGRCTDAAFDTWDKLNVPFPPDPRLYRQAFNIECDPGDVLIITGRQTRLTRPSTDTQTCARR